MGTSQVSLTVNDAAIELDDFVQRFIDHVVGSILATLKGTGEINSVDINIVEDKITIDLNNKVVPTNPFVSDITRNVITAMVSSLKGVREPNRINISIRR
ncbi:MAG TPA: hypothetical protein G4O09_05780 [Dehalococcoidia bacterium]|nr:hypothetical protein [Dehalococcoidia bacterium]